MTGPSVQMRPSEAFLFLSDPLRGDAHDQRHSDVSVRDEGLIPARTFPDWTMAYLRLSKGRFEGEEAVERALKRNLPPLLHNVLMEMTQEVMRINL